MNRVRVRYREPDKNGGNFRPAGRLLHRERRALRVGGGKAGLLARRRDRRGRQRARHVRSRRGHPRGLPECGHRPSELHHDHFPHGARLRRRHRDGRPGTRSSATSRRSAATRGSNRGSSPRARRASGDRRSSSGTAPTTAPPDRVASASRPPRPSGWTPRGMRPSRGARTRTPGTRTPSRVTSGARSAGTVRKRYGDNALKFPSAHAGLEPGTRRAVPALPRSWSGTARCSSDGRHRIPPTAAPTSSASPHGGAWTPIRKPSRRSIRATTSRGTASGRRSRPMLRATSSRTGANPSGDASELYEN